MSVAQTDPVKTRVAHLAAVARWWAQIWPVRLGTWRAFLPFLRSTPSARVPDGDLTRVEFERLVRRAFRLQGYRQVRKQARHEAWNIDLLLFKNGGLWFVQCEPDPASVIEAPLIADIAATRLRSGAQGAFLVTAGTFTRQARSAAEAHRVRLVDGQRLASWRQQVRLARRRRQRSAPTSGIAASGAA